MKRMKRKTGIFATLFFLAATVPLLFAQDSRSQARSGSGLPPEILGPQLIAWSQLQKPQAIPQPLPPVNQPVSPGPQPEPANPSAEQPQARPMTLILSAGMPQ